MAETGPAGGGPTTTDRNREHPHPPPAAGVGGVCGEEYRHLLARSPIPMLVHDQDSLLDVNQALATLLGYDLSEIAGLNVHQVVHPDDLAERDRETDALLTGAVDAVTHPCRRLVRRDHSIVWVRIHKSVLRSGNRVKVLVFVDKSWTVDVLRGTHTAAVPPQAGHGTTGGAASAAADTDGAGRDPTGWRRDDGHDPDPPTTPPGAGARFVVRR